MYPSFREAAVADQDAEAVTEFQAQENESVHHAAIFRKAARNFGLLVPVEHHHADQYQEALNGLEGIAPLAKVATQKWICRQCSMIYDPELGDPDSGIVPGTAFEDIPDDWSCPICGATKKTFMPYQEVAAA